MIRLSSLAPAKVNLSLRVLGKRADGFHDLASIIAFADFGDELTLEPGNELALTARGPFAAQAGAQESNLALKTAQALMQRVRGLRAGHFTLTKNIPVGAGLGGGSSDAAAALRLLAQANDLAPDDARILATAQETGADVPVCLDPRARLMHGRGEILSGPLALPLLHAVLLFPAAPLATALVFQTLDLNKSSKRKSFYEMSEIPRFFEALIEFLLLEPSDLEAPAGALVPAIGEALDLLARTGGARLVRMSGSGSAVFGIYGSRDETEAAVRKIKATKPDWWVRAVRLG